MGRHLLNVGFKKEMIVENQLEENLIAQRRIYDAVGDVDISTFEVPKKMIVMVQGTVRRCHEWLRIQKGERNRRTKEGDIKV